MSNVIQFVVHRQPSSKLGTRSKKRGALLEPIREGAATQENSRNDLGAAGRILPQRLLTGLKDYFSFPSVNGKESAGKNSDAAEAKFAALHDGLYRAYLAQDATTLESLATSHLAKAAPAIASPFSRMALEIYQFFKAKGCSATADELTSLAGQYSKEELQAFLAHSAELVSELKAQALAAIVNGTLVHQKVDLIFQIKAILAFQLVAKAVLETIEEKRIIPSKLICKMLHLDIHFPEWTFDVDPCDWHHASSESDVSNLPVKHSPLRDRLNKLDTAKVAKAAVIAQLKVIEDTTAAEQGRGGGESNTDVKPGEGRGGGDKPILDMTEKAHLEHVPYKGKTKVDEGACSCEGDLEAPCLPPDPCCAKINYFVTDTLVLRDRTVRYVASDLAYIENIAASESRTREHRFIKSIEDYTEEETTTTKSEERDHQVSEKSSVQSEIESNLKMSADMKAKYEQEPYSLEINAAVSKETSQKEAREQVREVVDKAVSKIQVQSRKLTSRRVTTTEEEKNVHTFKNKTSEHIVAKYFYVSKEVEGQVFSHGLRATVELLIPNPAALYEHLEKVKAKREFQNQMSPIPDLVTKTDIKEDDYLKYQKEFENLELDPPPPVLKDKSQEYSFAGMSGIDGTKQYTTAVIDVEQGYYGSHYRIVESELSTAQERATSPDQLIDLKQNHEIRFSLGGGDAANVKKDKEGNVTDATYDADMHLMSSQPMSIWTKNIESFSGKVVVTWTPLPRDLTEWQIKIARCVNEAHYKAETRKQWQEFKSKSEEKKSGRHPFADKEILLAELKRAAIYMMCQDFERTGVMNMKSQPCGYPEINRKEASETCWDWYFWERAFDWRLMSFVFFDYFWNSPCDWPEKFAPGHENFMFNSFLRAGMARVLIPISPAMTGDVIFYLQTGQKWGFGGNPPVNANDPRWVSVVEELKHSHDCYQNDREGMVEALPDPATGLLTTRMVLKKSDRYWDPLPAPGGIDQDAINNDVGREIFIGGIAYRIQNIEPDPNSPNYNPTGTTATMWWIITLDRIFEGEGINTAANPSTKEYPHAIGAEFVGAPFRWQEPTNLVWIGDTTYVDKNNTVLPYKGLPNYPVTG